MQEPMDAELEVQRTIQKAVLTAFLCLLKKIRGPHKVHVDNNEKTDPLWRGERKCIDPKAGDVDLWFENVGTIAPPNLKRNCVGSRACQSAAH